MKVEGAEVLSDVTQRTSRNLKGVAAVVIVIKLFEVKLSNLSIIGAPLPAELFNWVAVGLLLYLMVMLGWYWRVDYLLWRDGRILTAEKSIQTFLKNITHLLGKVEQSGGLSGSPEERFKGLADRLSAFRHEVMSMRRSLRSVERSARWLIIGGFLVLPELLGVLAALATFSDLSRIRIVLGI